MTNRIKYLEKKAKELEPNKEKRKKWLEDIVNYTDYFLDNEVNEKTFFNFSNEEIKNINFEIEDEPQSSKDFLSELKKNVDVPGLNPASGGHLGYIPGGGVFGTALGDFLAAAFNKYAGIYYAGPGAVKLENSLIRWMCSIIGFPKTALGNLTSGGSVATLVAVTTARDAKNISSKNITKSVIYLTKQAHHSVEKAIRIAGLSEAVIRYISTDKKYKMDSVELKNTVQNDKISGLNPFLVVASAGTTDTGAVDPLDKIAEIAKENNMWMHTDAAYGGFFILLDSEKEKFKGIEKSDSITVDPHKGLFLSYGLGAVLIKDLTALNNTHVYQANYMQDKIETVDEPSPADLSPELTKHFRGLRMWTSLKLFGLAPFKAALEEKLLLTRYFYEEIQKIGFEVGPFPELSVMIYRFVPETKDANRFNLEIVEKIKKDGKVFISSTSINGIVWLRLAVLSFRTHKKTIDYTLNLLSEIVKNA